MFGTFQFSRNQLWYWVLITLVFLSLIYSTSLHYAYGYAPEATLNLSYFLMDGSHILQDAFPDIGALAENKEIDYSGPDFWKLSSFWGDSGSYILQTQTLAMARAPYKYRFLPTYLVKFISIVTKWPITKAFVALNVLSVLASALLFTFYLRKFFKFSNLIAFLGGTLFVTMVSNTRTIPFPVLEPLSMFWCILIFITVISGNIPLFIVSSSLGVATKEILLFSSILWFFETFQIRDKREFVKNVIISVIPIIIFMSIRVILGGSALEVNYGYDILQGEFPPYWIRLTDISSLSNMLIRTFLSFSFLWIGIINVKRNAFLKKHVIIIPVVILAAYLLSGRITRVLGILYPIVIPLFLLFFDRNGPVFSKQHINTKEM